MLRSISHKRLAQPWQRSTHSWNVACVARSRLGRRLWTLPSPGLPDHTLRNHVDDEGLRTLRAFFGAKIFAQAVPPTVEQTFASYSGNIRAVIGVQMTKPAILSRISARLPIYAHKVSPISPTAGNCSIPKVQLLYAALSASSEQNNSDVSEWLKTLVGNVVPVIMDTVSDWEDANAQGVEYEREETGTETGNFHLTVIDDDDQVEGRSSFDLYEDEDDPDRLAELLAGHLTGLNALDE
ncbi:hypothetical protein RhiXN_09079 [Rhizoctonia solani]|uniref:Uncharacterized protein n=1 Tax=Rhizoctonia solani TaxID=456999 RepID=A0A8H8NUH3_9AGAM|nr:uncharacterized protein RhiXN_09079 [Rhizoctonia solani]QRW20104.1 hypothetical protein RhiXN_09079 [Rhizoctonia solani]